ncbi:MAG: hypothetical protein JKY65_05025 [Planctomycetes bacterium]|nr:hypothetical protein [Planctomycetota bacterium]
MNRAHTAVAMICLGLSLAGCSSTADGPGEVTEVTVYLTPPANATVDVRDFENEWADLARDSRGIVSAYEKALWVTERHNEALRLINLEPIPARIQAKTILQELLRHDPTISKSRFVIARILFLEAAYWFRAVDHWGYYMTWMIEKGFAPETPDHTLTKAELTEVLEKVRPKIAEGNRFVKQSAEAALRHFSRYRGQRPDDDQIVDYVWKLNLYLQNYRKSLQWLEYLLASWEQRDISAKDPARIEYEQIRADLERYLAEVEIEGSRAAGDPLPWRAKERSLLSGEGTQGGVSSPNR